MVMSTSNHHNRLPLRERRKMWIGCFKAMSCFGSKKGESRIVPASRLPEGNVATGQSNQSQATGLSNRAAMSMLAPPSSPASFSQSPAPSITQSPNCHLRLSANSPGGPSSAMFATGPYAHETQLVSPPVFSTYTTEPSTAPLTPPPELAHLTTPSSPDVPYARFLISGDGRSSSFPEREFSPNWDPLACSRSESSYAQTPETNTTPKASAEGSNFFCPATFARYYLDHDAPFSHTGGRLSVSKDSDVYPNSGSGQRISKQDMEELEAYRASFGFSADEVVTTSQYVEITHVNDDSLRPRCTIDASEGEGRNSYGSEAASFDLQKSSNLQEPVELYNDHMRRSSTPGNGGQAKTSRRYKTGVCSSDAEVDYRRSGRSFREGRGDFAWHD
uniref:Hydroxyproline-rich glycoprotein family protein n=1 Tax=Noccaea caerulescens TaxID=107243 RepID=A0A1J3E9U3_NOCCA